MHKYTTSATYNNPPSYVIQFISLACTKQCKEIKHQIDQSFSYLGASPLSATV